MRAISWVLALLLCLCAPAEVAAQQSQIGLKLGVQPWTPLTNDSTVQFVLDDPSRVSDALNQTWQTYSDLLATAITTASMANSPSMSILSPSAIDGRAATSIRDTSTPAS